MTAEQNTTHSSVNPDLLQEATDILSNYFKAQITIASFVLLSEAARRNLVLRITLKDPKNVAPSTLILKQSAIEKSADNDKKAFGRFARDWAGLEFLSQITHKAHVVPKFYGGSSKYRFILIEDLGEKHVSLVDSLTLPDRDKAVASLERYVKAVGGFHAAAFGFTHVYRKILLAINKDAETIEHDLTHTLNDLLPVIESANHGFGLPVTAEIMGEARTVIESMFALNAFGTLVHGDICPDNVFDHDDVRELQLIDFEWSFTRHALLDGTYLRMNMPTCWCAKAIPSEIVEQMEAIYREELKATIPAAKDDVAYHTNYTHACAFWMLSSMHSLKGIMAKEEVWSSGAVPENSLWKNEENFARPRFISNLQAFIDVATEHNLLPNLREMAANLLNAIPQHWPDAKPIELYPAFR